MKRHRGHKKYANEPGYSEWCEMKRLHRSSKSDLWVDDRWHKFPEYQEWHLANHQPGLVMCITIPDPYNDLYGPDTALFVTPSIHRICNRNTPINRSLLNAVAASEMFLMDTITYERITRDYDNA